MESNFVKADSGNFPKVDAIMVGNFFKNNSDFCSPELRNVKTARVKFTMDCPAQGNRNYIPVSELYTRNFTDTNGEFQLELAMGHVRTVFDTEFRLPTSVLGFRGNHQQQAAKVPAKLESSYFSFGGFDWNLALYPHGAKEGHAPVRGPVRPEQEYCAPDWISPNLQGASYKPIRGYPDPRKLVRTSPDGAKSTVPEKPAQRSPKTRSRTSGEKHSPRRGTKSGSSGHKHRSLSPEPSQGPGACASTSMNTGEKHSPRRCAKSGSSGHKHRSHSPEPSTSAGACASTSMSTGPSLLPHVYRDWNYYPSGDRYVAGLLSTKETEGRVSFYLNRCTGFDHQCRVRYSVALGDGERRVESGVVDDVSDSDGKSYGWHPKSRFVDLIYKGAIRVHLEMILANTLSEVISNILVQPPSSSSNAMGVIVQGMTQCYDRDKHGWNIKTDSHSDTVRLHMVYKEIHNVPRNHLRYVSWTAYVLRFHGKHVEPIPLPGAPFSHYYAQEVNDEGIIMETDITMKELREQGCPYLSDKGQLRIQVEWEESYLLFQATYHKYDDVTKIHNNQMRKEINALQAENYSLERQLFSYQKSIAFAHSRGTYSDDLVSPECRGEEEDERYYEDRAYSVGDRSLSTDTEYA